MFGQSLLRKQQLPEIHKNVLDSTIAHAVLNDMSSFSPTSYKFSRTSVVKQIPDKSKISAKAIHPTLQNINTEIILQRLSTVGSEEQKKAAFKHELATYPASLFTDDGIMRDSHKSKLGKLLLSNEAIRYS